MLYGNNLDEPEETDLDGLICNLRTKLMSMGVAAFSKDLLGARVMGLHPSKNIPLKGGYTACMAIQELRKASVSRKLDIDYKDYRNNGESLQFYANSYAFTAYDKISDLKKPQKRAIDKDQTAQQRMLFDYIKDRDERAEILRLEVRLKKRKLDWTLKELGYSPDPTLKDIFKKEVCQKIMLYYWDYFFSDNLFLFSTKNDPQDILKLILARNPGTRTATALKMVGLYMLGRDEEGMRGFRQIIDTYKPKTDWEVVKKYLETFEDEIFANSLWGFMKDIRQELKLFNSFKIKDYGQSTGKIQKRTYGGPGRLL